VSKITEDVEEGSTYVVEKILVAKNDNPKYKITPRMYKLNCMFSTNFIKIKDDHIPINHFDFVSNKILNSPNED